MKLRRLTLALDAIIASAALSTAAFPDPTIENFNSSYTTNDSNNTNIFS